MKHGYNIGIMPPPKKKDEDKRTEQINVMFTPRELATLKIFAARRGLNVSTYIRQAALADYYAANAATSKDVLGSVKSSPDDNAVVD